MWGGPWVPDGLVQGVPAAALIRLGDDAAVATVSAEPFGDLAVGVC